MRLARGLAPLALAAALGGCTCQGSLPGRTTLRPPEMAGSWYPEEPAALDQELDRCLKDAAPFDGPGQAIVVPHAAYAWSGKVAGQTWGALAGRAFDRVVLLGANHKGGFPGAALPAEGGFRTPVGSLLVDEDAVKLLDGYPGFARRAIAFDHEHSLELQLPFVARLWPRARIVPVMLGDASAEELADIGVAVRELLDERTLVVASSDFTHFGDRGEPDPVPEGATVAEADAAVRDFERPLVDALLARDASALLEAHVRVGSNACGIEALLALVHALGAGDPGRVVARATSLDVDASEGTSVGVSYVGAVFPVRFPAAGALTSAEQQEVARLVRDGITAALAGKRPDAPAQVSPRLAHAGGAFVTFKKAGALRACVGVPHSERLVDAVLEAARATTVEDSRFGPVGREELKDLEIEISVLGPLAALKDPLDFEPGRHGLVLTRGDARALLLPQVATEEGLEKEQFLAELAKKAGLPAEAWKDAQLERFGVQTFTTAPPR